MALIDMLLIGIGLSMDAFAVSICKGLGMRQLDMRKACVIALFFGGFQALMPFLGWLVGAQLNRFISSFGPWIAFGLLAFIGAKMIFDALRGGEEEIQILDARLDLGELVMLAFATSIDALAVGVSFAFLDVAIAGACALIGITTFALSLAGVAIGHLFGGRWEKPSQIVGGIVLVAIGTRILLEGLGVL